MMYIVIVHVQVLLSFGIENPISLHDPDWTPSLITHKYVDTVRDGLLNTFVIPSIKHVNLSRLQRILRKNLVSKFKGNGIA